MDGGTKDRLYEMAAMGRGSLALPECGVGSGSWPGTQHASCLFGAVFGS